ncbi:Dam family site-specific DNA-(adenine-N6)-methyltransferase, partial [Enterococcus faecalis]|nr:Dam family site-specific DNA-(adenine-N6)-methyltransferase [Enterococcus faecalis]
MKNERYGAFVKWAGGKSKLAPIIEKKIIESILLDDVDTYVEPFLGGGSFFFYMIQKYNFKNKIISDINWELINLYKVIQLTPEEFIVKLDEIQDNYNNLQDLEEKSEFFYSVRKEYNDVLLNSNKGDIDIKQAVNFLFLNKLGFNGLYRVNLKGLYNVPFGKREKASLYNKENILGVSSLLSDVKILNCEYEKTFEYASRNTLFYFDPPYRPLSSSSSFTSYSKSSFNDNNQIELANFCKKIDRQGAKFALSNSDPKNNNSND